MSSTAIQGTGTRVWKRYGRWEIRFVLALLSCGIANAQSLMPAQTGNVSDRMAIGSSSGSNANSTPLDRQHDVSQAGAKPGIVTGTVLDRSGSVVAGAAVHLTSESNSFSQQTIFGYNGELSFANVPPGPFKLSVTAQGFDKQEISEELASGQTLLVPRMVISIATVVSQVKVTGNPVEENSLKSNLR